MSEPTDTVLTRLRGVLAALPPDEHRRVSATWTDDETDALLTISFREKGSNGDDA